MIDPRQKGARKYSLRDLTLRRTRRCANALSSVTGRELDAVQPSDYQCSDEQPGTRVSEVFERS
jgi:hypothetical protein